MTTELPTTCGAAVRSSDWLGRIVNADCLKILSLMHSETIDMVLTSPPYGNLRQYGNDKWDFFNIGKHLARVLKPGGVMVWVSADETINGCETMNSFKQAEYFVACGLKLWDTMIYEKNASSPNTHHKRYGHTSEFMFVFVKGDGPSAFNPIMRPNSNAGEKRTAYAKMQRNGQKKVYGDAPEEIPNESIRGNVWKYNVGWGHTAKDAIAYEHPAPFPESLAKDHIASWSNPGDVILDPFAGSGTTLKAAKELNRQWCGIEIHPEYCKIAEARLSQDVLQLEIRQDAAQQKQPDTAEYCAMGYRIDSPHAMRPNVKADARRVEQPKEQR